MALSYLKRTSYCLWSEVCQDQRPPLEAFSIISFLWNSLKPHSQPLRCNHQIVAIETKRSSSHQGTRAGSFRVISLRAYLAEYVTWGMPRRCRSILISTPPIRTKTLPRPLFRCATTARLPSIDPCSKTTSVVPSNRGSPEEGKGVPKFAADDWI